MEGLKNLGLIARQQSLQPGEVLWGQVAASLAMSIRSSAPDEDVSCYGIDVEPGFVRRILSPGQSGGAALHEHPHVAVSLAAQSDTEVGVRIWIMLSPGNQQDLTQFCDRMINELVSAQQLATDVVLTGDVPPM